MSYKVYKSQNYFVVHDTATSTDVIRQVRDLVRWEKKGTLYSFYYNTPNLTTVGNSIVRLGSVYEFSDLQDSTGTAWGSQALLDLYLEQWTGHICCNTAGEDALYDVQNTDGTSLKTGAIPSGETTAIEIPDITFTDSNGDITTVPAGVDIVASACAGPTYNSAELMKTGQTVSYATGDDGDLEKGRSLSVLSCNNPFGNTNRFTDDLGGQTYTNNIVIDWSTFNGTDAVGYVKNPHTLTGDSWANSMSFCNSFTLAGFSGWRNVNELELRNIQSRNLTGWFNYSPFNIPNGYFFHTSNTLPELTGSAIYSNYINFLFQSFAKATNAGIKPFPCRNFTLTELGL